MTHALGLARLDDLDDAALSAAYAPPRLPWLRTNFVATLDAAVTGGDGLSGSINNAADHRVFASLREWSEVVIVGAGTARAEGYRDVSRDLVVVSRSAELPASLLEGSLDRVWIATGEQGEHLSHTRSLLGERCLVLGQEGPDLTALVDTLHGRGFERLLCEGGPGLAHDLLAAELVDEYCLTVVPRIAGGNPRRLVRGGELDTNLELAGMLQAGSTLLQRWLVVRD